MRSPVVLNWPEMPVPRPGTLGSPVKDCSLPVAPGKAVKSSVHVEEGNLGRACSSRVAPDKAFGGCLSIKRI